jgi:hypothetical protein
MNSSTHRSQLLYCAVLLKLKTAQRVLPLTFLSNQLIAYTVRHHLVYPVIFLA